MLLKDDTNRDISCQTYSDLNTGHMYLRQTYFRAVKLYLALPLLLKGLTLCNLTF